MADAVKAGGLRNVTAGESRISSIDGERGILAYAGIDIHELVEHSTFEEVVFLLHHGRLPAARELEQVASGLAAQRGLPDGVLAVLGHFPAAAHPMAVLRTLVSALGELDPEVRQAGEEKRQELALRLVGQMATLVAAIDRARRGAPLVPPDPALSHAANFLYMLTAQRPEPQAAKAMDAALILHADHEFNASTFAARVAASTLADLHGAIVAALATLKGPLHGGANEAVMKTLEQVDRPERAEGWVREALAAKRKIMGFGHAVYRGEDPRATSLRRLSRALGEQGPERRWFDLSEALAAAVKSQKGLFPNVDFFSASLYHVLGIPTDLFTPVFAVSRIAGWTAHVLEQWRNNRLIRPESVYTGPRGVPYVPIQQRG